MFHHINQEKPQRSTHTMLTIHISVVIFAIALQLTWAGILTVEILLFL